MTHEEYEARKAATRAAPGWKPSGEPNCGDCETMSHCESHHKIEGMYPGQLADMPDLEDIHLASGTAKTRWILYSGEDVEPDQYDNLDREFRCATWVLTHVMNVPAPVRSALERFVRRIAELRSTSAPTEKE